MARYISCTETAKLIRTALKKNFPGIKFSVKSSSYAGGASISIEWLDGPSMPSVEKVTKRFQGATFDGMIDLQSYVDAEYEGEKVHFGANYVNCRRRLSRTFVEAIVAQFCKRFGMKLVEVKGDEKDARVGTYLRYDEEHWLNKLLHNTDAKDMYRAYEAEDEQEAQRHAEWEAGAEARKQQADEEYKQWQAEEKTRHEREQREQARRHQQEQQEQAQRQQQHRRDTFKVAQRQTLATRVAALSYLGLSVNADRSAIMSAFRNKVRLAADGHGDYSEDMDFLVRVKERALQ